MPRSAIHVSENALFAGINLLETIPDATIGNFKAGRTVTTEIFDDMQVFVDFVTDVVPMGEANSRTHAFALNEGLRGFLLSVTLPNRRRNQMMRGGNMCEIPHSENQLNRLQQ